jgi:FkbM family methyltransferase
MKSIIKKLIASSNYKIVSKKSVVQQAYSGERNMEHALRHLKTLKYEVNCIVDVGAGCGTESLLSVFPDAEYILIEPLEEFHPQLEMLKQKYNVKKIISAVVGTQLSDVILNVHPDLYGSSLLNENEGPGADGEPRKVKSIELKNEIAHLNNQQNNILKVDVQGAELDVLKSAYGLLHVFDVIILEVSFFKFQKNAPEFSEVINFMNDNEYVIYDIFDLTLRPLDNALAQADILFVRKDGKFRHSHDYADANTRQQMKNV